MYRANTMQHNIIGILYAWISITSYYIMSKRLEFMYCANSEDMKLVGIIHLADSKKHYTY
jgi:hypothetical protein